MLYNIDMEFIQAFNPLYAFPIVTVVFCVVIVYALGFKSPVQPPSFDGLDEDKKYSKKRKTKEIQRQNKSISNGKANGIAVSKGKATEVSKKKDIPDNVIEKLSNHEKSSGDKKALKKVKSPNEKKLIQVKKKENLSSDEPIEDGWVQLVSKKGRKNRKKDENIAQNIHPNRLESVVNNVLESGESSDIKESPKHTFSVVTTIVEKDTSTGKTQPSKDKSAKKSSNVTPPVSTPDSTMNLAALIENVSADENRSEPHPNIPTVIEESNKSKKKKKKQAVTSSDVSLTKDTSTLPSEAKVSKVTSALPSEAKVSKVTSALPSEAKVSKVTSALPSEAKVSKVTSALPSEAKVSKVTSALLSDSNPKLIEKSSPISQKSESNSDDVQKNSDIDMKSNVAFDELAGLYPETKEKKKKKVRRDH